MEHKPSTYRCFKITAQQQTCVKNPLEIESVCCIQNIHGEIAFKKKTNQLQKLLFKLDNQFCLMLQDPIGFHDYSVKDKVQYQEKKDPFH